MRYTGAGWVDDDGAPVELPTEPPGDGIGPAEREPDVIVGESGDFGPVPEPPADDPREVRKATRDRRERKST